MPDQTPPSVQVRALGLVSYEEALALQDDLKERRRSETIPDQLLLLEHPHVLTLGSSTHPEHILLSEEELERLGIQLFRVGRGGDVTYHGPGQLVGYPILSLASDRRDLHRYLRDLEEVLLRTLSSFDILGTREKGLTGVWVEGAKVAALGVRVSSGWITSHGFALNVDPDLTFYSAIVPCGIHDRRVTSMARILGRRVQVQEVLPALIRSFEEVFSRTSFVV